MKGAETIQAAIHRLELFKSQTTPGPWWGVQYGNDVDRAEIRAGTKPHVDLVEAGDFSASCATFNGPDALLIVSLHRTIDAQLAILRDDYDVISRNDWLPNRLVLALAKAILGGA